MECGVLLGRILVDRSKELSTLFIPEEYLVNAGLCLLVTLRQRCVFSPTNDDPQDPEQLVFGELEDGETV